MIGIIAIAILVVAGCICIKVSKKIMQSN